MSSVHVRLLSYDIQKLDRKFRKSCDQILILNNQIEDLQTRYDQAMNMNRRSFRYSIRLNLATLEGVRNMFYEFASRCADRLEVLQNRVIQGETEDIYTDDNPYFPENGAPPGPPPEIAMDHSEAEIAVETPAPSVDPRAINNSHIGAHGPPFFETDIASLSSYAVRMSNTSTPSFIIPTEYEMPVETRSAPIFLNEEDLWKPYTSTSTLDDSLPFGISANKTSMEIRLPNKSDIASNYEAPLSIKVKFGYAERRGICPINEVHYAMFNRTTSYDVVMPYYVDCDLLNDLNWKTGYEMDGYAIKRLLPDVCGSVVYEFVLRESVANTLMKNRCSITMEYFKECSVPLYRPSVQFRYLSEEEEEENFDDTLGDALHMGVPEFSNDSISGHPLMHYICLVQYGNGMQESIVQNFYSKAAELAQFDFTERSPDANVESTINDPLSLLLNTQSSSKDLHAS